MLYIYIYIYIYIAFLHLITIFLYVTIYSDIFNVVWFEQQMTPVIIPTILTWHWTIRKCNKYMKRNLLNETYCICFKKTSYTENRFYISTGVHYVFITSAPELKIKNEVYLEIRWLHTRVYLYKLSEWWQLNWAWRQCSQNFILLRYFILLLFQDNTCSV